jgi:hypothetical protein
MFEIMARSEYGEGESIELIEKAKKDLRSKGWYPWILISKRR